MVGEGGWCIHFDQSNRSCRIYPERPRFCRVEPETFQDMYGIEAQEVSDFAIDCCHQHIESTYGRRSIEMVRFNSEVYGASGR
jgi:Fe-S-cluster containining protein